MVTPFALTGFQADWLFSVCGSASGICQALPAQAQPYMSNMYAVQHHRPYGPWVVYTPGSRYLVSTDVPRCMHIGMYCKDEPQ